MPLFDLESGSLAGLDGEVYLFAFLGAGVSLPFNYKPKGLKALQSYNPPLFLRVRRWEKKLTVRDSVPVSWRGRHCVSGALIDNLETETSFLPLQEVGWYRN